MIYLFLCCGAVLKAPCICCKAVGEVFDDCCKGCSRVCDECCKALSDLWAPIVQNPLGVYVIGTWIVMVLVIAACAATVGTVWGCNELAIFCFADIGIALSHSVFAFYIQRRLVNGIGKIGKDQMTHDEITVEARNILKYDIGFCLYFFFFVAAFVYNCHGVVDVSNCVDTGFQTAAVTLMILYGVGVWNFGCCWYCGQCCFGEAEKKGIVKTRRGGAAPTVVIMGAPAASPDV